MKLFSWLNKKKVEPVPISSSAMSYQTAMLQGQGARENQEDRAGFVNEADVYAIQKSGLFAVVADGMGGIADGALASTAAVRVMQDAFEKRDTKADAAQWLCASAHQASAEIYGLLQGVGGSTLVACYIHQEQLWFASVGDSFFYLYRGGQLIRLNRSHTVSTRTQLSKIREGVPLSVYEEDDPQGHALTQFLGMSALTDIDHTVIPMQLKAEDILLLCSDGVTGPLTQKELARCMSQESPQEVCEALRQTILSKNDPNQDNFTALVIRCAH